MRRILALTLLLGFASCSEARLRIENASAFDFDRTVVTLPSSTIVFPALPAGRRSEYVRVGSLYEYAGIKLVLHDGRELLLQPIDYVGESLHRSGSYTYRIELVDASGGGHRLSLSCAADS